MSETCNSDSMAALIGRCQRGDTSAVNQLLASQRDRVRRTVSLRLDPRVAGRVDDSDIVQEAMMEASRRLPDYLERHEKDFPLFVWMRKIAIDQVIMCHRRHLGAAKRDVKREVPMPVTSESMARALLDKSRFPDQKVFDAELLVEVEREFARIDEDDREILMLRHFEQMSNIEAAEVLGINPSTASSRYLRALKKMHDALKRVPGLEL